LRARAAAIQLSKPEKEPETRALRSRTYVGL
jgi:hypothetical protein